MSLKNLILCLGLSLALATPALAKEGKKSHAKSAKVEGKKWTEKKRSVASTGKEKKAKKKQAKK